MGLENDIELIKQKEYALSSVIKNTYSQLKQRLAEMPQVRSAKKLPETISVSPRLTDQYTNSRIDGSLSSCNDENIIKNGKFTRDFIFAQTKLSSISENVPLESLTSLNQYSFNGCKCLTQQIVNRLSNATSIGSACFYGSGSSAFTSAYFPNATSIGKKSFEDCKELTSVYLPKIKNIPDHAFSKCHFSSVDRTMFPSLTAIGDQVAFREDNTEAYIKTIDLPLVKNIGRSAFIECTSLTSVNLPNLERITGYDTFYHCLSLSSISLPLMYSTGQSNENRNETFKNCYSLVSVDLPSLTAIYGSEMFFNCNSIVSICIPKLKTLIRCNDGIYTTAINTFNGCTKLKYVDIPNCSAIGLCTFHDCIDLLSANLSSVSELCSNMFLNAGTHYEETIITVLIGQNTILEETLSSNPKFNFVRV